MKAITLHRPVDWAMAHGGKDLENRGRKPPASIMGERIALHAGKTYNYEYADWIKGVLGIEVIPTTHESVVVATTVIVGWVGTGEAVPERCREMGITVVASAPEFLGLQNSKWFLGPYAWVCRDTIAIAKPPLCTQGFHQGIWNLPPEVERAVLLLSGL